jgi:cytochrome b
MKTMNEQQGETLPVWDIGIRLFHWTLVTLFIVSYLSGDQHDLHTWSGYAVIGLLGFRLFWGFFGSRHARFADFLYPPRAVWQYLAGLLRRKPPHYAGHNPAGGWMVFLLLTTLLAVCYSGLEALADEGDGPLAKIHIELIAPAYAHGGETHASPTVKQPEQTAPDNAPVQQGVEVIQAAPAVVLPAPVAETPAGDEKFWSALHHQLVNVMLWLIAVHITGVIVSSILHRENLVAAMLHGRKQVNTEAAATERK